MKLRLTPLAACAATLAMAAGLSAQTHYTFNGLQAALGNSLSGADFIVSHGEVGGHLQVSVATDEIEGFPTEGSSYLVISSGDSQLSPIFNSDFDYKTAPVPDPFYIELRDIGGVAVEVALPAQATSLSVDYKYWTWDYFLFRDPFWIYLDTPSGTILVDQTDLIEEFGEKLPTSEAAFGELHTVTLDISAWAGQSVTLRFLASDQFDGRVDSGVLLDNLFVEAPTNQPPVAVAGQDVKEHCTFPAGAEVQLDGTLSFDPDGDQLTYLWSAPKEIAFDDATSPTPTATFPLGVTTVMLTVSDSAETSSDSVEIMVFDDVLPSVSIKPSLGDLWPPNHRIEDISISIPASDECTEPGALVLQSVEVSSSEPDDSTEDQEFIGDAAGADGFAAPVDVTSAFAWNPLTLSFEGSVGLRAEREGDGSGRTYSIMATVLDGSGNATSVTTTVVVPHSNGKK